MKNNLKNILLACMAFVGITTQVLPYAFFYRQTPAVVVYHEPIIYHHEPSLGEFSAGVIGACAGIGLMSFFEHRAYEKRKNQYQEMFQDLGYHRTQAKIYAKMAADNPGGFQAVVKNIEREEETMRNIKAQQNLMQCHFNTQKELEQLKHQQKLEKVTYEHQLKSLGNNTILLIGLLCLSILSFFGGMFYHRKRK